MDHHNSQLRRFARRLLIFNLVALWPIVASAETFYVRPGVNNGDGSSGGPWNSVAAALQSGTLRGGDEVRLLSGAYGKGYFSGVNSNRQIRFVAHEGATAHFESIVVRDSKNLVLEGLSVWPANSSAPQAPLVHIERSAANITIANLEIRGAKDVSNYMQWARSDWNKIRSGGILAEGKDAVIQDNTITAISGGMGVTGKGAIVTGNVIRGFTHDGVQATGDNLTFRGNRIQDCFAIDRNHDDGFQSWSSGPNGPGSGTVRGLTIESNYILQWTGKADHPLACSLQGIGMFDGMYEDLTIVNNVISVSAYHGIGISGAINANISHNTLVNPLGPSRQSPWIDVTNHKNGQPSRNVTMVNNLAPIVRMNPKFGTMAGNATIIYPAKDLVAPYAGDFRPKPDSQLINSGVTHREIKTDNQGRKRNLGGAPDIGAFEVR